MHFDAFSLHEKITTGIAACGFTQPTPIQAQALPLALDGKDVLGLAQTGTGKTAAFVLPILQRLMSGPRRRVRALIVSPTRELAEQTVQVCNQLGRHTGLKAAAVYGGVGKKPQVDKIRSGAEIIVACPGRLLDHLTDRSFNLKQVEMLVLDEADRMFDMGFLPDIHRILSYLPAQRQNMLFSATMPADIRALTEKLLVDPAEVRIDHEKPSANISQALYPVETQHKTPMLLKILEDEPDALTLVFTKTKHGARKLAQKLKASGYKAADLHGNLSQAQRRTAMAGFRSGRFTILVATDIAARGIDVERIARVINFDMPDTAENYTHRIGRTGRIDRSGLAMSLIARGDMHLVRAIERNLGKRLERKTVDQMEHLAPPELMRTSSKHKKPEGPRRSGRRPSQHRR